MTNVEIMSKIIVAKNKKDVKKILNRYRVPIKKSKYC